MHVFYCPNVSCAQMYTILFGRNVHEVRVAKSSVLAKVLDFRATRQFCLEDQVMDFWIVGI